MGRHYLIDFARREEVSWRQLRSQARASLVSLPFPLSCSPSAPFLQSTGPSRDITRIFRDAQATNRAGVSGTLRLLHVGDVMAERRRGGGGGGKAWASKTQRNNASSNSAESSVCRIRG